MIPTSVLIGLSGVVATATPVLIAVLGETITERAGIINLSLNGTIILSAMGGFAVTYSTGSLALGFLAGMIIGALMALIVAFSSIDLHQSQVAVGFVLALFGRDLAYFLGVPFMNTPGPSLSDLPIPLLKDIPVVGVVFFRHDVITYISILLIGPDPASCCGVSVSARLLPMFAGRMSTGCAISTRFWGALWSVWRGPHTL
jgi:ABC-type uncharacterized transport system permease subunit